MGRVLSGRGGGFWFCKVRVWESMVVVLRKGSHPYAWAEGWSTQDVDRPELSYPTGGKSTLENY